MTEPTTTAAVLMAVAASLAAAFLAFIGISGAHLFWGLTGCALGIGFAPKAGRVRAVFVFNVSALVAAKAGVQAAVYWSNADVGWGGFFAMVTGIVLHPLIAAAVKAIPSLIASRLGAAQQPDSPQ